MKTNTYCSYCKVDYNDLEPADITARIRIDALLFDVEIEGKTFLDIGFNSGLLSLQLAKRGALHVTSIDLQKHHVDNLNSVIKDRTKLCISVLCQDFMHLENESRFDVVFFLEVLHWAVHQGYEVSRVLDKVTSLTNDILFLEFPWDCTDPSISSMTSIISGKYDSFTIFKHLHAYFKEISFVYFPNYFDNITTKRVLLKCSKKRQLQKISTNRFSFSGYEILKKGTQERPVVQIVEAKGAYYALKTIHSSSYLGKAAYNDANLFLESVSSLKNSILVKPLEFMDGVFLNEYGDARRYISEYVFTNKECNRENISLENLFDIYIRVAQDFMQINKQISSKIIAEYDYSWMTQFNEKYIGSICNLKGYDILATHAHKTLYDSYLTKINNFSHLQFSVLSHTDLNISNILSTDHGYRVIDFENTQPATVYFDGLFSLIIYGADHAAFCRYVKTFKETTGHEIQINDIYITMIYSMAWINYVLSTQKDSVLTSDAIQHFTIGYDNFLSFAEHLL